MSYVQPEFDHLNPSHFASPSGDTSNMLILILVIFLIFKPQPWPLMVALVIGLDLIWSTFFFVAANGNVSVALTQFLYSVSLNLVIASIANVVGYWWKKRKNAS